MAKQKEIKNGGLGELVNISIELKDEFRGKIVDENHPYPETQDKYGGKRFEYEKPLFEKQTTLNFPEKIWERLNLGKFYQACSRCHHCR